VGLARPVRVRADRDAARDLRSAAAGATALDVVRAWLAAPSSVVLEPTQHHLEVLAAQLGETGTGGNLVSDAHLAGLAIEHRATVVTFDRDFERFGVRTHRPTGA
jgi:uncharacterized protein